MAWIFHNRHEWRDITINHRGSGIMNTKHPALLNNVRYALVKIYLSWSCNAA